PRDGAADARALGAGPQGLKVAFAHPAQPCPATPVRPPSLTGPGVCQHSQRGSVGDAQLPVNPMQVDLDGTLCEPEAPADFLVGNALRQHQDYLALSLGQGEILINRHPSLS